MADDLAARVKRLEAIEDIQQLKHRYFRAIDRRDTALMEELFTDDVGIDYEGGTYRWQLEGAPALIKALRASFNPSCVACHTAHHPEISVVSDTEASGRWYLTDFMINREQKLITSGSAIYQDTYRKLADGWRIARSTYKRVYEIVEKYEKEPGITYAYLSTLDA